MLTIFIEKYYLTHFLVIALYSVLKNFTKHLEVCVSGKIK